MNEFGKETLNIKGLELEDLSGSYDVKELGVNEVANGAGIGEVGAAAAGDEQNKRLLEILAPVCSALLLAGIIFAIYWIYRISRKNSFKTSQDSEESNPNREDVESLTTALKAVVDNLGKCTEKMDALKAAVMACNKGLKTVAAQDKKIESIANELNEISNTLPQDEENLEKALVVVKQKLQDLNALNKNELNVDAVSNLTKVESEFKRSVEELKTSLVKAEIVKLDGNDSELDFSKYTGRNDELKALAEKFDRKLFNEISKSIMKIGVDTTNEIDDQISNGSDVNVIIESEELSVNQVCKNCSRAMESPSEGAGPVIVQATSLQKNIMEKLAAIKEAQEPPKHETPPSSEEDKGAKEKQAQIKALKEKFEALEQNVEKLNKAVENDGTANRVNKIKEEINAVKMSASFESVAESNGVLEKAKKEFEQANGSLSKIEEEYKSNVVAPTDEKKKELNNYINELKKITESGLQENIEAFNTSADELQKKFTSMGNALNVDIDIPGAVEAKKAELKGEYKESVAGIIGAANQKANEVLAAIDGNVEDQKNIKSAKRAAQTLQKEVNEMIGKISECAKNVDTPEAEAKLGELKAAAEEKLQELNEKLSEIEQMQIEHQQAVENLKLDEQKELVGACKQKIDEFISAENLNVDESLRSNLGAAVSKIEEFLTGEEAINQQALKADEIKEMRESLQSKVSETKAAIEEAKKQLEEKPLTEEKNKDIPLSEKEKREFHRTEEENEETPPSAGGKQELLPTEREKEENPQTEEKKQELTSHDDVNELISELTTVVGKLGECTEHMSKLKQAVTACEVAQQDIEPKIKSVQSIIDDLNSMEPLPNGKGDLEELSVNLEEKLRDLNKLNEEDVGDDDLSNLDDTEKAFKDSFSTLNGALVETAIKPNSQVSDVADQMENFGWNLGKYEVSGNEKLAQLIQQFGKGEGSLNEIYGSVKEDDIKVLIGDKQFSVNGVTTGLNGKQENLSDGIKDAQAKVAELKDNINRKLATINEKQKPSKSGNGEGNEGAPSLNDVNVNELTNELTNVINKLGTCADQMNKLKNAVSDCNKNLEAVAAQDKEIKSIASELDGISSNLSQDEGNLENKENLEKALEDVKQKLQALNKLTKSKFDPEYTNRLEAAEADFKRNVVALESSLVDAGIVKQDGNDSELDFSKYDCNDELKKLAATFDVNSYNEIYGSVKADDIKVTIENEEFSVNQVFKDWQIATDNSGEGVAPVITQARNLQETIEQKLAAIENKGNESPNSGTSSSSEKTPPSDEEKQAQIKALKEKFEALEQNVETFNQTVKDENIASKSEQLKNQLAEIKLSESIEKIENLDNVGTLLTQVKQEFEQANASIDEIGNKWETDAKSNIAGVKEELAKYIKELKEISESEFKGDIEEFDASVSALNEKFTKIGEALSVEIDISEEVRTKKDELKGEYEKNVKSIVKLANRKANAVVATMDESIEDQKTIKKAKKEAQTLEQYINQIIANISDQANAVDSTEDAEGCLKSVGEFNAEAEKKLKELNEKLEAIESMKAKHKEAVDNLQVDDNKDLIAACKQKIDEFLEENKEILGVDALQTKASGESLLDDVDDILVSEDALSTTGLDGLIIRIERFLSKEEGVKKPALEEEVKAIEERLQDKVSETKDAIEATKTYFSTEKPVDKVEELDASSVTKPAVKVSGHVSDVADKKEDDFVEHPTNEDKNEADKNEERTPSSQIPSAPPRSIPPIQPPGVSPPPVMSMPGPYLPPSMQLSLKQQIINSASFHVTYNSPKTRLLGPQCSKFDGKEKEIDAVLNKAHDFCVNLELGAAETLTSENLDNLINDINSQFKNVTDEELNEYTNLSDAIKEQCKAIENGQQGLSNLLELIKLPFTFGTRINSDENFGVVFRELKKRSNELAANIDTLKNLKEQLSKSLGVDFKNALYARVQLISLLEFDVKAEIVESTNFDCSLSVKGELNKFLNAQEHKDMKSKFDHLTELRALLKNNEKVKNWENEGKFDKNDSVTAVDEYPSLIANVAQVVNNYENKGWKIFNTKLEESDSDQLRATEKAFDDLKTEVVTQIMSDADEQITAILGDKTLEDFLNDASIYEQRSEELKKECVKINTSMRLAFDALHPFLPFLGVTPPLLCSNVDNVLSNLEELLAQSFEKEKIQECEEVCAVVNNLEKLLKIKNDAFEKLKRLDMSDSNVYPKNLKIVFENQSLANNKFLQGSDETIWTRRFAIPNSDVEIDYYLKEDYDSRSPLENIHEYLKFAGHAKQRDTMMRCLRGYVEQAKSRQQVFVSQTPQKPSKQEQVAIFTSPKPLSASETSSVQFLSPPPGNGGGPSLLSTK